MPPSLNFPAPVGSPEEVNVTLITSTSSSLTWLPPPVEVRHGVVREYQINVTEVDTGRELVLYSSTPSITISNLHPYYTYLCRVSASTIGYGPFTEALTFTTLEDGELLTITIINYFTSAFTHV